MRVKIGDKIYDSKEEPIMVILEDYNKEDISNMAEDARKYCEFPDDMSEDEAREFMKTDDFSVMKKDGEWEITHD